MTDFNPTAKIRELTRGADLSGHDRQHLNRMLYWKTKKFWSENAFGPKPGQAGCQVPERTQRLFDNVPELELEQSFYAKN